MKPSRYYLYCTLILMVSCNSPQKSEAVLPLKSGESVIIDRELYDIIVNSDSYAVSTIDQYYKNLKSKQIKNHQLDELKICLIKAISSKKEFSRDKHFRKVEYYVQEMMNMEYIYDFEVFFKLLYQLLPNCDTKLVQQKAYLALEKTSTYARENFDDPMEFYDCEHVINAQWDMFHLPSL